MSKQQIGVIGLAVMGKNLALNMESRGYSVAVYNRSRRKTDEMLAECADKHVMGAYTLEEFVNALETPRKIVIMVKAGAPVDDTIAQLKPYLQKNDILIDRRRQLLFQRYHPAQQRAGAGRFPLHRHRRFRR